MGTSNKQDFFDLSVVLTGFSEFDLKATGVGAEYFETALAAAGSQVFGELLDTFRKIQNESNTVEELEKKLRRDLLSSPKLGPLARNILKMWYLGSWTSMPESWQTQYAPEQAPVQSKVVSAQSYVESLVWKAAGTHPMGAKQPGFGTWSEPINVNE